MKIFKRILLVIACIIGLGLIVAAFAPKDFVSQREIVINKPRTEVFDYIKYLKNQDHYGVWQLSDPNMKKTYTGQDGTVDFTYAWDSKKLGKGAQTIVALVDGQLLKTRLDFGFGNPAICVLTTEDVSVGATKVIWSISGTTPFPFNIMSLFYDMGQDFETGLGNLKHNLESH